MIGKRPRLRDFFWQTLCKLSTGSNFIGGSRGGQTVQTPNHPNWKITSGYGFHKNILVQLLLDGAFVMSKGSVHLNHLTKGCCFETEVIVHRSYYCEFFYVIKRGKNTANKEIHFE